MLGENRWLVHSKAANGKTEIRAEGESAVVKGVEDEMRETRSSWRYRRVGGGGWRDVRNNFAVSDEKSTFNRQRCDERKWMKPKGKRRDRGPSRGRGEDGKRKLAERGYGDEGLLQRRRRTEITARW